MSQKLILSLNNARITASFRNTNYKNQFGYTHYGVDMTDKNRKDKTVWGSGIGEITHCGWHPSGGNVIVAVYKDCLLPTGEVKDIAIRYYHLEKIYVKAGQKITKDTKLGLYGNTGMSNGDHLHLETDYDVKYPNYTPQTSKSNDVLKAGNSKTTLDPRDVLWCKTSSPDCQSVVSAGYDTVSAGAIDYKKCV